jgi:hypothetical protein
MAFIIDWGTFVWVVIVMRAKKCSLNLLEGDKKNILGLFG